MKRGISLIAVLMFMLAATAASVVLFKWIGSENFSSAARLKYSEAYQASESGLDAVKAWLSFKAADVGFALGEHLKNQSKRPFLLNDSRNNVLADLGGGKQGFKVYLMGADTASKPYKLKFMSLGTGRDGSQVMQTAIFSVDGLYNIDVPVTIPQREPNKADFDEDIWGNVGTVVFLESMRAVITQSPAIKNAGGQALNTVKIGTSEEDGYLVLDGNYYVNNGMNIYGDVYSTGMLDFCPQTAGGGDFIAGNLYVEGEFHPKGALRIDGDAFLNGGVNPNTNINDVNGGTGGTGGCIGQANGGVVRVVGNSTISDNFVYYSNPSGGGLGFRVEKNLVMDKGDIILTRASSNDTDSLSAGGDVYIANPLTGTIPGGNQTKHIPLFGEKSTSVVCVPNMSCGTGSPKTCNGSNNIQMRTYASQVYNLANPQCSGWQNWGADPLDGSKSEKNLRAKLEQGNGELSCENTPIKFDTTIYTEAKKANPPSWAHRADRPGSCAAQEKCEWDPGTRQMVCVNTLKLEVPWVSLDAELKDCWDRSVSERRDGWLVVYLKNYHFGNNGTSLGNGKYIIILEDLGGQAAAGPNDYLYLPPTGNAEVMLYLPKGWPNSNIELAGGSQIDSDGDGFYDDKYNYFIFSDGNIKQFNTTQKRKLTGSIFMNKCSIVNTNATNPYLMSKVNRQLIDDLMERGILQESGWNGGPPPPPNPDDIIYKADSYIIPLSPRLKVELESKYISKEPEPSSFNAVEKFVLAMPRVLRLPEAALDLGDYYNLLYLNGAEKPQDPQTLPKPTCTNNNPAGALWNELNPVQGVYTCSFASSANISDFYVKIQGLAPPSTNPGDPGSPAGTTSSSGASSSSSSVSSSSAALSSSSNVPVVVPSNCAFSQQWCPGISYGDVIPNSFYTNWIDFGGPVCIFATEIEAMGNNDPYTPTPGTSIKVNGKVLPNKAEGRCGAFLYDETSEWRRTQLPCADAISQGQVARADGGYYIYITKAVGQPFRTTGGTPDCSANSSSSAPSSSSLALSSSSQPSSSSSVAVTATCKLVNRNNQQVTNLTVTQGENINAPVINCSSGNLDKNNAVFKSPSPGEVPGNWSNWKTSGNAHYTGSYQGNSTIAVSNFYCGSTQLYDDITCGTITANRPSCSGASGNVTVNEIIRPNVSCGNATLGNRTFTASSGGSWTNNNVDGGSFSTVSSGTSPRIIYLSTVYCDGNPITVTSNTVSCGTGVIVQSSSSGSGSTDYCYGVAPNVTKGQSVSTVNAVCAKISGSIAAWQVSNGAGRSCRVNGGNSYTPPDNATQSSVAAGSDGYVYIYCSAGNYDYFSMSWW
jgi:hypothetical protein